MKYPACFGSPVAVSHLCETCRACCSKSACAHAASAFFDGLPDTPVLKRERQRMALVRQALTELAPIGAVPGSSKRVPLTAEQQAIVAELSKQTGSLVRQLFEKGWFQFARREMAAGRNPGHKNWQRILCQALMDGGITRPGLIQAYQEQLGLTPGSAKVRAHKAVTVFRAGRLLTERNGHIELLLN